MKKLCIITLLAFASPLMGAASHPTAETTLMRLKKDLAFIPLADYLHNRMPFTREKEVMDAWELLRPLREREFSWLELENLLPSDDAKTRTLVLLGLVAHESPKVVPHCLQMLGDEAETFPNQFEPGGRISGHEPLYTQPMRVRDVAAQILTMMGNAPQNPEDRAAWWDARRENPDWLGWQAFLYARASQGVSPVPEEAKDRLLKFRQQLDTLPKVTRAWALLYIADDIFFVNGLWQPVFATEEEMLEAVRAIAADDLVDFLRTGKRAGLKVPDLDEPQRGMRFVVSYAGKLLEPKHAAALQEMRLFAAAAVCDPSNVRAICEAGLQHFKGKDESWERGKLMAVLGGFGDAQDQSTAERWYYEEAVLPKQSSAQSVFLTELSLRRPPHWKVLLRAIANRAEFEKQEHLPIVYFASACQHLAEKKFLPENHAAYDQATQTVAKLREFLNDDSSTKD